MDPTRAYARHARDEARLIAAGCAPASIYLEGRGHEGWGSWTLRPGETLGVVDGLRALGEGRRAIALAVGAVHGWGAVVVDAETGQRTDADGVEMLATALAAIHGERVMPDRARAVAMQANSVKARVRGRMPAREAVIIWRRPELTTGEAAALMTGWSVGTAYKQLGKRGLPGGRRGNNK